MRYDNFFFLHTISVCVALFEQEVVQRRTWLGKTVTVAFLCHFYLIILTCKKFTCMWPTIFQHPHAMCTDQDGTTGISNFLSLLYKSLDSPSLILHKTLLQTILSTLHCGALASISFILLCFGTHHPTCLQILSFPHFPAFNMHQLMFILSFL